MKGPPTREERLALQKIDALQTRLLLAGLILPATLVFLQLLPERHSAVSAGLSVALALGGVALLVYRACFLRCPRCSGWIAIPKCPACGLKLDKAGKGRRTSANG